MARAAAAGPDAVLLPKVETPSTSSVPPSGSTASAPGAHPALGDNGDAARHPERSRDRRRPSAARGLRARHERPGQGSRRRAHPRPAAAGHQPRPLPARRARRGLVCVDGVYNAFQDAVGLRAVCVQGRDMGFDGKTLIHPDQLAIANEVFALRPTTTRSPKGRWPPSRRPRHVARASRSSTAASSRTCTWSPRAGCSRAPPRSPRWRWHHEPADPRPRRLDRRAPVQACRARRPLRPRRTLGAGPSRGVMALADPRRPRADHRRLPPRPIRAGLRPAVLGHPPQQPPDVLRRGR